MHFSTPDTSVAFRNASPANPNKTIDLIFPGRREHAAPSVSFRERSLGAAFCFAPAVTQWTTMGQVSLTKAEVGQF